MAPLTGLKPHAYTLPGPAYVIEDTCQDVSSQKPQHELYAAATLSGNAPTFSSPTQTYSGLQSRSEKASLDSSLTGSALQLMLAMDKKRGSDLTYDDITQRLPALKNAIAEQSSSPAQNYFSNSSLYN